MKAEPKTILYFLWNYFEVIRELFDAQKHDNLVKKEYLHAACKRYGSDIQSQLIEYKILRRVSDDFEFHSLYYNLVEFVLSEFKPLLPETIEKYFISISKLSYKIKKHINGDTEILQDTIDDLSGEIRSFFELVERNTIGLLRETRELKSNMERIDYREKVIRASRWIDEYIIPLNKILDINHSESIAIKLYDVAEYVNHRRLNFEDEGIRLTFEKLYNQLMQTNDDLLRQSKILTHELLPLIERIRTESLILSGWIEFLKNPYKIEPPAMLKVNRDQPYSKNIYLNTIEFFEQFKEEEKLYFDDEEMELEKWIYNKAFYKEKLMERLPLDNFFKWCSKTLKTDYNMVETEKLFSLLGLLFEEDLEIEFAKDADHEQIETTTSVIKVPKIKIKAANNGLS
jgi:hypothetical protein